MALRAAARQLAPVIYTVVLHSGAGVWGPFLEFSTALQTRVLQVLQLAGCLTPALRRALCALARCPSAALGIRNIAADTLFALALGDEEVWGEGEGSVDAEVAIGNSLNSALCAVAAVLSLLLGRSVDLQLPPGRSAARCISVGSQSEDSAELGAESCCNWGWGVDRLCGSDEEIFDNILCCAENAASRVAGRLHSATQVAFLKDALVAAILRLLPSELDPHTPLPSLREASTMLSLQRFFSSIAVCAGESISQELATNATVCRGLFDAVSVLLNRGLEKVVPCKAVQVVGGIDFSTPVDCSASSAGILGSDISLALTNMLCSSGGSFLVAWIEHATTLLHTALAELCDASSSATLVGPGVSIASHSSRIERLRCILLASTQLVTSRRLNAWWCGRAIAARPSCKALLGLCTAARAYSLVTHCPQPQNGLNDLRSTSAGLVIVIVGLGLSNDFSGGL